MRVTQVQIARRLGLHVSTVNRILNRRVGPSHSARTVRRVFAMARKLGYPVECLKHEHRRRHPRRTVDLPVEIRIYTADGTLYDQGQAVLRNVSLSGALLEALVLPGRKIPAGPHLVGIRMLQGPLRTTEVRGRPVRFVYTPDALGLAIEFVGAEEAHIRNFMRVRA